jgi:hypothetical protein
VTEGRELNIFGMGDGDFFNFVGEIGRKVPKNFVPAFAGIPYRVIFH